MKRCLPRAFHSPRFSRPRTACVRLGLIVDYALGGALAAIRYTEPFTTYDADVFFIPADTGLSAGFPAIYTHLQSARPFD